MVCVRGHVGSSAVLQCRLPSACFASMKCVKLVLVRCSGCCAQNGSVQFGKEAFGLILSGQGDAASVVLSLAHALFLARKVTPVWRFAVSDIHAVQGKFSRPRLAHRACVAEEAAGGMLLGSRGPANLVHLFF